MPLDWLNTPLDADIGELIAQRKRGKAIETLRRQLQGRLAPPVGGRPPLAELPESAPLELELELEPEPEPDAGPTVEAIVQAAIEAAPIESAEPIVETPAPVVEPVPAPPPAPPPDSIESLVVDAAPAPAGDATPDVSAEPVPVEAAEPEPTEPTAAPEAGQAGVGGRIRRALRRVLASPPGPEGGASSAPE